MHLSGTSYWSRRAPATDRAGVSFGVSWPFVMDRNIRRFLWYGGFAGEGLRSVGVEPPPLIQEQPLYPAPGSPVTGQGPKAQPLIMVP
jgi:hypothetical protein